MSDHLGLSSVRILLGLFDQNPPALGGSLLVIFHLLASPFLGCKVQLAHVIIRVESFSAPFLVLVGIVTIVSGIFLLYFSRSHSTWNCQLLLIFI